MKANFFIIIIALFSQISCMTRIVDCTMVSTKNFSLEEATNYEKLDTRIEGEDKIHMIIFIPLGLPDIKEALDNTIEQVPGCIGLADAVLYNRWFYIPYIYGQFGYVVEATPIVRKGSPRPPAKPAEREQPSRQAEATHSENYN